MFQKGSYFNVLTSLPTPAHEDVGTLACYSMHPYS